MLAASDKVFPYVERNAVFGINLISLALSASGCFTGGELCFQSSRVAAAAGRAASRFSGINASRCSGDFANGNLHPNSSARSCSSFSANSSVDGGWLTKRASACVASHGAPI